jgi:hypothetical protein
MMLLCDLTTNPNSEDSGEIPAQMQPMTLMISFCIMQQLGTRIEKPSHPADPKDARTK